MCDISDGLSIDAGHIASASGVSINLSRELISKADDFKDLAELSTELSEDTFDWILNGGEDHFFIATVDPKYRSKDLGIEIGIVEAGDGEVRLDAKQVEIKGYQHF
jgi:thiamine-monophosphate kinase